MDISRFGGSLPIKSLWRGLFGSSTWSKIIQHKYLKDKYFSFWYRNGTIGIKQGSTIWISFLNIENIFIHHLARKFQSDNLILISIDLILGAGNKCSISRRIIHHLHGGRIYFWGQVINGWQGLLPIWKMAHKLRVYGQVELEWN